MKKAYEIYINIFKDFPIILDCEYEISVGDTLYLQNDKATMKMIAKIYKSNPNILYNSPLFYFTNDRNLSKEDFITDFCDAISERTYTVTKKTVLIRENKSLCFLDVDIDRL